jgi:hypothetical protein
MESNNKKSKKNNNNSKVAVISKKVNDKSKTVQKKKKRIRGTVPKGPTKAFLKFAGILIQQKNCHSYIQEQYINCATQVMETALKTMSDRNKYVVSEYDILKAMNEKLGLSLTKSELNEVQEFEEKLKTKKEQ